MAATCSYSIDGNIVRNSSCFASIREVQNGLIIIEEVKFSLPKRKIIEYLNDLKKMGFNFTFKYDKINKEIVIDPSNIIGRSNRVFLFMLIRFIWEGFYLVNQYDKNYDNFYLILPFYFKLKRFLPNENKLKLLFVSINYFTYLKKPYNSNHFPNYVRKKCKIFETIPSISNIAVNDFFSGEEIVEFLKNELTTKKEILEFYQKITK